MKELQTELAAEIDRLRAERDAIIGLIKDRAETFHTESRRQVARDILNAVRAILA